MELLHIIKPGPYLRCHHALAVRDRPHRRAWAGPAQRCRWSAPEVEVQPRRGLAVESEGVCELVELLLDAVVAHRVRIPQLLQLGVLRRALVGRRGKHRVLCHPAVHRGLAAAAVAARQRHGAEEGGVEGADGGVGGGHVAVVGVAQAVEEAHRALNLELEGLLAVGRVEQAPVHVAPHPARQRRASVDQRRMHARNAAGSMRTAVLSRPGEASQQRAECHTAQGSGCEHLWPWGSAPL